MARLVPIFAAIGRASLFAVGCGGVCLVVAEVVLGYNLYFQPNGVVYAACYAPAMLGGVMYLGQAVWRLRRRPIASEASAEPGAAADWGRM